MEMSCCYLFVLQMKLFKGDLLLPLDSSTLKLNHNINTYAVCMNHNQHELSDCRLGENQPTGDKMRVVVVKCSFKVMMDHHPTICLIQSVHPSRREEENCKEITVDEWTSKSVGDFYLPLIPAIFGLNAARVKNPDEIQSDQSMRRQKCRPKQQ